MNTPTSMTSTMNFLRSSLSAAACAAGLLALALAPQAANAQTGMTQLQAPGLPITLIYPTAETASPQAMGPFTLQVAPNATPRRGNGRLVVLSHGTGGSAMTDHDLAHALADAGFVVAQPEHGGDNWRDQRLSGPEAWKQRPLEVSRAIDAVMKDPRFAPLLDVSKVGVHGMSAGGGTGLALAGGQWSVETLTRHCAAHMADDAGFCFYGLRVPAEREARAAAYANPQLQPQDKALQGGAAVRDPRIAAVAVTVPMGAPFTDESLAAIRIPVGVVEATGDVVLTPAWHSGRVLKLCGSCVALGPLQGANHFDTLSPWPAALAQRVTSALGVPATSGFDRAQLPASHQRIAAFFQRTLVTAP